MTTTPDITDIDGDAYAVTVVYDDSILVGIGPDCNGDIPEAIMLDPGMAIRLALKIIATAEDARAIEKELRSLQPQNCK